MFSSNSSQVSSAVSYIEDVFSTYLYTGNDGTLPIVNGIDLSTYGGMTWLKSRTYGGGGNHQITDTVRGINAIIKPNLTDATATASGNNLVSFNTNGFTLGSGFSGYSNFSGSNNVVWTFRKQPKFFDIQSYSGSNSNQTITHSLGSAPGCIFIKKLDSVNGDRDWNVYHRSLTTPNNYYLQLNTTVAQQDFGATYISNATSTSFTVNGGSTDINRSGSTYIAYLFAHNAGGFGLTGTDNVISCGGFTSDASGGATVSLGYEPQWLLVKRTSGTSSWQLYDNMRGLTVTNGTALLYPNLSNAESVDAYMSPTATGFVMPPGVWAGAAEPFIYIAIRRGPMAVPTVGTSVFTPVIYTGNGSASRVITTGIKTDLIIGGDRGSNGVGAGYTNDRLRGQVNLITNDTAAEAANVAYPTFDLMTGYNNLATGGAFNATGFSYIRWAFQRAPSFFDEVCYTGTGSATTQAHNLGAVPELMIVKCRSTGGTNRGWWTYVAPVGNTQALYLNTTDNAQTAGIWNNTTPTSTVFSIDGTYLVNGSGATYVAYLFATCAGVSKVGSYTGTGATQTISCGFTGGARFVLIKRTDSTGDWYVWDTARGMVSGTDPSLLLNSTAAEVNANSIYTATGGFQIVSTAAGINASGGSYIYFSVA